MLRSTSLHQCSGRGWWLTTCRSGSPSTAVRESSEFARCPYRTLRSPAGGLSNPHVARSLRRRSASRAGRRHWPLVRRDPLAHRYSTMAGVPTHPTAPHGRKQRPDQRSLDESPPFAIERLRARTGRFAERSLLSGATAPPRSRPSPRTREPSSGCSSPHARAPHGPVAPRQQPVPGSCDSSLVSRASWPWVNRRRVDGDDRPNDQPHDVDAGERHERPKPPPIAELVPEEWLRRCLHPLCDHHPTVLSLRHARSLPASAAAIALHRPIARRKLVPPDRERAVPIAVELRCPPSRLDRASQHSPCRETAQLR
jgi:hypothetical protein